MVNVKYDCFDLKIFLYTRQKINILYNFLCNIQLLQVTTNLLQFHIKNKDIFSLKSIHDPSSRIHEDHFKVLIIKLSILYCQQL